METKKVLDFWVFAVYFILELFRHFMAAKCLEVC
jgi:hypothetical protein